MPEEWTAETLGAVTREEGLRAGSNTDSIVVLSSTKHRGLIPSIEYFKNRQIFSDDLSAYKIVRPNWFAYATNHLAEGSIGLQSSYELACVSPIYTVFSCSERVYPRFLQWILKSDNMIRQYSVHDQASVDRRGAVRYRDFAKISIKVPPLEEQRRIVQILDALDEQIGGAERRLLKLQKLERGQLLNVMRAAEDIASHGVKVGEVGEVKLGRQRSPEQTDGPNMVPYLRVANVYDGWIDYSDVLTMNFSPAEQTKFELKQGDILLNEGQSLDLVGRSAIYDGPPGMFFQNTLVRFRAKLVTPDFARLVFKYWLEAGRFMAIAKRTTSIAHLGADRFASMDFPLINLIDQRRAVDSLKVLKQAIGDVIAERAKFERLKSALMDDLLTGRVRVPVEAETLAEV